MGKYAGAGGRVYGYRIADQGTNWGTSFPGGTGKFKGSILKKALGLGVSSSFLGGAASGVAGTFATYSVYHRYHEFQRLMYMNNPTSFNGMLDKGWYVEHRGPQNPRPQEFSLDDDYYSNYYSRKLCRFGCPPKSHCEWGFCECDVGLVKTYGRCHTPELWQRNPWPTNNDRLVCTLDDETLNVTEKTNHRCNSEDINLVCNPSDDPTRHDGMCEFRRDMKWNPDALECQIYLNVNCSTTTYETEPSNAVWFAVQKAKAELVAAGAKNVTQEILERTQTKEESLANSLLKWIDPKNATADEIREAFCRDVDAFSFEFQEVKDERLKKSGVLLVPKCVATSTTNLPITTSMSMSLLWTSTLRVSIVKSLTCLTL